ncbi:MAG: hypothetical protein PHQ65_13415 [Bacteroidales bacterium]|jgi:membrane-bound ClpP family serine protease|nr:hypothetical protein [Bacteroidales bacterium]MDD3666258.1 hypothetical protein [Bacteroidales bacterium]
MSLTIIIILIALGLVFLVAEVLVIPGTSVAGVLGFIAIAIGIWQAWAVYGTTTGVAVTFGTLVATATALYFSLKSNTWKKLMLNDSIDSKVNLVDTEKVKPGDTGVTLSRLAPAGKARINGEMTEVHSISGFIDQHRDVVVVKTDHQKIIVKLKTP